MSRFNILNRLTIVIATLVVCSGAFLSGHGRLNGLGLAPAHLVSRPNNDCQDQPRAASALRVSRLSKAEFSRTVWDLIGADAANSLPALSGLIAGIPDDDMSGGFANVNWSLSTDHVAGYLGVANEIAVQVVAQDRIRRALLPCATNPARVGKQCLNEILDDFAARAYRRPLSKDQKQELRRFYDDREAAQGAPLALQSLIARVLMSPQFLLKITPAASDNCKQLRADRSYARAAGIAYSAWGTMPDAALLSSAEDGGLLNDAKLAAEATRMLGDAKAREWLRTFFHQWLHYEHVPIEGYSAGFLGTVDRAHLHEYAADELDRFIDTIVWSQGGSYRDLLTARTVLASGPAVRQIYGLPKDPSSQPEQLAPDRAGILTRVAMLVQGFDDASVVKRGAFIRRQILCDPLSPPDPSLLPPGSLVPPEKDHRMTTRQRWEARTAPAICQGCHRMINPLGFSLEAYDGVGRFRTTEKQPIPDSSPQAYSEFTIDTSVTPFLDSRTEPAIDGPVALSAAIGSSRKANACFVKQLNTFVSRRAPDAADAAALQVLTDEMMRPGGSIKDVLLGLVKLHATKY